MHGLLTARSFCFILVCDNIKVLPGRSLSGEAKLASTYSAHAGTYNRHCFCDIKFNSHHVKLQALTTATQSVHNLQAKPKSVTQRLLTDALVMVFQNYAVNAHHTRHH